MEPINPVSINVHQAWKSVGGRTILYYAYLLSKPLISNTHGKEALETTSITKQLKSVVTLQNGSFDDIIRQLHIRGIVNHPKFCTLTRAALPTVDSLFFQYFGTNEPIFNGYNIVTASRSERWKNWIEMGSQHLINSLSRIKRIKYKVIDQFFSRGRIVILEHDLDAPVLIFWFVNTPRIKKTSEFGFISEQARKMYEQRIKKIGTPNESTKYGLSVIDVIAAPTYEERPAQDALLGRDNINDEDQALEARRRLIGPINFEIICHYLIKNSTMLEKNYLSMLAYLDPISGPHSGVILSDPLIEFMKENASR